MAIDWICNKKPTTVGACTGAVAGLVAITPAAGTVDLLGAVLYRFDYPGRLFLHGSSGEAQIQIR